MTEAGLRLRAATFAALELGALGVGVGCEALDEISEAISSAKLVEIDPAGGEPMLLDGPTLGSARLIDYSGAGSGVLAFGWGVDSDPIHRWDAARRVWSEGAAPPFASAVPVSFAASGRTLCLGGDKSIACYDLIADTWFSRSFPVKPANAPALYAWAGRVLEWQADGTWRVLDASEPDADLALAAGPWTCESLTAGTLADTLYVVTVCGVYAYSEVSSAWSEAGTVDLPELELTAHQFTPLRAAGGSLCALNLRHNSLSCFDPVARSMTLRAALPEDLAAAQGRDPLRLPLLTAGAGSGFFVGINDENESRVHQYDVATDSWSTPFVGSYSSVLTLDEMDGRIFALVDF